MATMTTTPAVELRHEYWIRPDGVILPDIGLNHEGLALKYMIQLLYEKAEHAPPTAALFAEIGPDDWDGDVIGLREALLNAADALAQRNPEQADRYADYDDLLLEAGVPQPLLAALFHPDVCARTWAVLHGGWICVKGQRVTTPGATPAVARQLRDGLWDILAFERQPGFAADAEFMILDVPGDRGYVATWAEICEGTPTAWHYRATQPGIPNMRYW